MKETSENPYNFYRPRRTTFNTIADLLDEESRARETQRLMIDGGMATRTFAGARFFGTRIKDQMTAMQKLRQYPHEWIEAVKLILELRRS